MLILGFRRYRLSHEGILWGPEVSMAAPRGARGVQHSNRGPFSCGVGVGARRVLCAEVPKGHAPEHSERVVAFPDSCTKYTIFIIFLYVGRIGRLPPSPPRGVAILAIVGFC